MSRLVGAVFLVMGLLAPLAAAAQMNPSEPPTVTGPLTESNDTYAGDACTKNTFDTSATSKRCRYFYRFDPAAESDAANDYGVWWFQVRYTPKPGWCLVGAKATVTMTPEGFQATGHTVKNRKVHRKKKTIGVKLEATAGGNTTTPGSVKKRFVARKGRFTSKWDASARTLTLEWTGRNTRHKVALAGGLEGPWDPTTGPPAFTVESGPTYREC